MCYFRDVTITCSQCTVLVECLALWGERERSRRQYSSQVSVFKPALFTEHSNADKKKRRTVADSVANVGESVAYLGVSYLADAGKARLLVVCSPR